MKKIRDVEATPSKRIYHSIIADYHLDTALCELIDNAIDNWLQSCRLNKLSVRIDLDIVRQIISVIDNSGGIKEELIQVIVSPGSSNNTGDETTIGFFGVGSKRAVVALSEEIKIFSRYKNQKTVLVIIDDNWINDEHNWDLPVYETTDIDENSTLVELVKLRYHLTQEKLEAFEKHISSTYAQFLNDTDLELSLNGTVITPTFYETWSFPPGFEPKLFTGTLDFGAKGKVSVEILGGLMQAGDPAGGEYGAYFYCNNRLIAKAYKGMEIGYRQIKIGAPHPSVSIARAIVKLTGPAQLMPWNSSKSNVNDKHATFIQLQEHIEQVLVHYSHLSKTYSSGGGWESNVFKYGTGTIKHENLTNIGKEVKLYLPPIPRIAHKKYPDLIKSQNKTIAREKPWVKGHYEAIIAVNELPKLKLEQNNRLSLLILDSSLEIAFKDFLINESGETYSEGRFAAIMKDRSVVHSEIKKFVKLTPKTWQRVEYFYKMRGELVHKRISVSISNEDLSIFKETVEKILHKMFKLSFKV
jgi:hypothetical protein